MLSHYPLCSDIIRLNQFTFLEDTEKLSFFYGQTNLCTVRNNKNMSPRNDKEESMKNSYE